MSDSLSPLDPAGLVVSPPAVAEHGARVLAAVAALDRTALARAARTVAIAAPGPRAAAAAEALARRWEAAVAAWADDVAAHGAALRATADDDVTADATAARAFRDLLR